MNYGIYKDVRNAAWQCLIDTNTASLPLSVVKTAEHYGIAVVKNGPRNWLGSKQSGAALKTEEGWIICYDERESRERIRFTVCHELGHILLGHPLKEGTVQHTRTIDKDRPKVESEADMFAARVLAPACVIWALGLHTPQEISDLGYSGSKSMMNLLGAEQISPLSAVNSLASSEDLKIIGFSSLRYLIP